MSSSDTLTQKWLRQNLQPYLNADRVFSDIDAVLTRFNTLRPKTDVYTYDDGRTQLLLCVHGVLPITFRRATYNIPVALWITRGYPRDPPISYVVPTNDMLVKPGPYVDVSGRCSPEYVRNWERKSEGCNLITLLEALQDLFSSEPPLFSKPKAGPTSSPFTATSSTHDRPAIPPKPRLLPSPAPLYHTTPSHSIHILSSPPPLPSADHILLRHQVPPRSPASSPHHHPGTEKFVPPPNSITTQTASVKRSHDVGYPLQANAEHQNAALSQSTSSQQHIRHPSEGFTPLPVTSLLDEDAPIAQFIPPAPPRPPNPELLQLHARLRDKIKSEINALSQALASDAERLRTFQTNLLAGEPAVRDEIGRLEAVRDVCRTVSSRLYGIIGQAEKNVTELRRRGDPDIDEMVCATTIVHNHPHSHTNAVRLINLVAEDNAIEDTIYQLHRALNAGRIDLDRFLRTTRVLAEEQFLKRALIEKIKIGMPTSQSAGSGWS